MWHNKYMDNGYVINDLSQKGLFLCAKINLLCRSHNM